ncbi:MAG: hypothetical protein QM773_04740 [Hyphomonadaceae bacterium]
MDSEHYDLSAYPLFRSVLGARPHTPKRKRCLVIDPSGHANGDVRQHADTLWKYVIQPAILDTDFEAHRAASNDQTIGQDVVNALLDDDLVIAVLAFDSPHVFYETALAQAAARPLILMVEEGRTLSFDPRNAKVVTYRLDTESVVSAVHVTQLQGVIREIENQGSPACHGFRPGTAALGGGCEDSVTVYERSPKFSYDRRLDMIREAETRIDIMGVANLALALHPDTVEVIRARGGGKVEIRVLQCAPSNAGLVAMLGARHTDELAAVQQEIETAAEAWRRVVEASHLDLSFTIRRAQVSLPMASALITDKAVVATPYLRSRPTSESPTLHARAGDAYHATMCEEFNLLWSEATTVFRADPAAHAVRARSSNAAANSAAYWAQAAAPAPAPAAAPVPVEAAPVNGVHHEEAPETVHAADGNDAPESVHHKLFGSPLRDDASADESPVNGSAHKAKPSTVNERGHAIIRSVC